MRLFYPLRTTEDVLLLAEAEKLKRFLVDKGKQCLHRPSGLLPRPYVTPTFGITAGADDKAAVSERSTVGHYLQMYDWDSCLFSQAAHRIGHPELAESVVTNFISQMQKDGYIPRTISPARIWDAGDQCKPFLCQSLLSQNKPSVSPELVRKLAAYLSYFDKYRKDRSGLYRWRNVLESGVDNNYALLAPEEAAKDENSGVGSFPDGRLLAVDLNSYLVAEFLAFSKLAQTAGEHKLAADYDRKARILMGLIEDLLWNPQLSMYCNAFPQSHAHVKIRAWTGLVPVLLGFARKDRAAEVIERNIMSPRQFLQPAGLASVAGSERLFNNAQRGLYGRVVVSNWQGPVWVLPNAFAARGLKHYNYNNDAEILALRTVSTLSNDLEATGTLHENYNAETGSALWAPNFMSWNILALELIDFLQ
jgi:putative isomerase